MVTASVIIHRSETVKQGKDSGRTKVKITAAAGNNTTNAVTNNRTIFNFKTIKSKEPNDHLM